MLAKIFCLFFVALSYLITNTSVDAAILFKRTDEDSMTCPSGAGGAGAYPVPYSCKKYYYCTTGDLQPVIQSCSADTLFSAELRRCVVPSRANCNH